MLNCLKASMIVLFVSMFAMGICNNSALVELLFVLSFTIFVALAVISYMKLCNGKEKFKITADKTYDIGCEHKKNRRYVRSAIYFAAIPMCIVGLLFAAIDLICMWAIVFK